MQELTDAQIQWIEALESGEYTQATGILQNPVGYCCLGVACKVAEKNGVRVRYSNSSLLEGANLAIQPAVQKWLGLISPMGSSKNSRLNTLVNYNDSGSSFEEIAALLREHPDQYFVEPD